jgi:hypothetical protein
MLSIWIPPFRRRCAVGKVIDAAIETTAASVHHFFFNDGLVIRRISAIIDQATFKVRTLVQ